MSILPEGAPRTFREVAIVIQQLMSDLDEIKQSQKRISNMLITTMISTLVAIIASLSQKYF